MMTLLTGQPGHGKTAYGLVRARKWKAEGRDVYAFGIRDLDYDAIGFKHIDDPAKWMDLPDGSALILDECYNAFPNRNPGAKVPDHVNLLATHRHRGFDFIFIAQQTVQIDPFMKGLFEEHIHVKREVREVHQAVALAVVPKQRQGAVYRRGGLDSSERHLPVLHLDYGQHLEAACAEVGQAAACDGGHSRCMLLMILKHRFEQKIAEPDAATQEAGGLALRGTRDAGSSADHRQFKTTADYAKAHLPRFATMPWTAPIYDERRPVTDPELFCASSGAGLDALGEYREAIVHVPDRAGHEVRHCRW